MLSQHPNPNASIPDLSESYVYISPEESKSTSILEVRETIAFGAGEYLAHTFAYSGCSQGFVEIDGKNHYQLIEAKTSVQGLVCYIFKPLLAEYSDYHVIFRGTKCLNSVGRDLEASAPGNESFANASPLIMQEINLAISDAKDNISINIYGHSLGGADAQCCFTDLMEKIYNDVTLKKDNYHHIKILRLMAYSSAGVSEEVAKKAKKFALQLKPHKIALECFWLHSAGDVVQQTGVANILSDIDADIAIVHLLKVRAGDKIEIQLLQYQEYYQIVNLARPIVAHTKKHFTEEQAEYLLNNYEYYNNTTVIGKDFIRQKLCNKSSFLQSPFAKGSQQVLSGIVSGILSFTPNLNSKEADRNALPKSAEILSALRTMAVIDRHPTFNIKEEEEKLTSFLLIEKLAEAESAFNKVRAEIKNSNELFIKKMDQITNNMTVLLTCKGNNSLLILIDKAMTSIKENFEVTYHIIESQYRKMSEEIALITSSISDLDSHKKLLGLIQDKLKDTENLIAQYKEESDMRNESAMKSIQLLGSQIGVTIEEVLRKKALQKSTTLIKMSHRLFTHQKPSMPDQKSSATKKPPKP